MKQFEIGKTYITHSACDHNCIISITIKSRTAKTITTEDGKRFKFIKALLPSESIRPWGAGSMMPIISASSKVSWNATDK